jgi:hypothetical protein
VSLNEFFLARLFVKVFAITMEMSFRIILYVHSQSHIPFLGATGWVFGGLLLYKGDFGSAEKMLIILGTDGCLVLVFQIKHEPISKYVHTRWRVLVAHEG